MYNETLLFVTAQIETTKTPRTSIVDYSIFVQTDWKAIVVTKMKYFDFRRELPRPKHVVSLCASAMRGMAYK